MMKTTQAWKILFAALILLAATCDPKVKFENPQPNGKKNLDVLPAGLQGKYLELADSSILTIDSKTIVNEVLKIARLTKQQLWTEIDTVFEIDTIVTVAGNMTVEFDFYGDSVQLTTHDVDTLFNLMDKDVLRKFKGIHFLNTPLKNELWKVQIMRIKGDSLMLTSLVPLAEVDSIISLTPVITIRDTSEDKVEEYRLNPSIAQLKKILARKEMEFGYVKQ
ncbi:MAG: hypothetical protein JXB24_07335 [Bacteroidales bacterium]|nr:hypothetical protein [Bacteroidales bacterium]